MTGRFNCTLVMSLVFSSCVTRPDIDAQVTVMKVENDQLVVVANSYDEGLAWKGQMLALKSSVSEMARKTML